MLMTAHELAASAWTVKLLLSVVAAAQNCKTLMLLDLEVRLDLQPSAGLQSNPLNVKVLISGTKK